MSHITGTLQVLPSPFKVGPSSGEQPNPPNTWTHSFPHNPAPGGTKLLILHFQGVVLPGNSRLEVDLGYDTDLFTSADGAAFWTRPVNVYVLSGGLVPIRFIRDGGGPAGAEIDRYGRGEEHAADVGHTGTSNSDPFLDPNDPTYDEPDYDPFWFCSPPPSWQNAACAVDPDIRADVARAVGMIVTIEESYTPGVIVVSTCSVTLVDSDKVVSAAHCHSHDEALTSSVTFDYQTGCNGNRVPGYNARFYKVKAVLAHGGSNADYSLLQLAEAPPGVPVVQMRPDLPQVNEPVFGVHHPNGAVKKISPPLPNFSSVVSKNATEITVPSSFHVSGGSSGSGLFDAAGRILGVLSNGNPCGQDGQQPTLLEYFPTATILTAIAPAPPPPVTRDVMIVFDRSGSMSEPDSHGRLKIESARDAISLFVQLVLAGTGNRIGLVSFSAAASSPVDHPIAAVTDPPAKGVLIGPPPYAAGKVGALNPGGTTSIGEGLDAARLQFPGPGLNPRAILLLTDGMENTPRWISDVTASLNGIDVHAIGFGTDANLDSAQLSSLTAAHGGVYTRATSGLGLLKFFGQAFGNIFEAGVLFDPEHELAEGDHAGEPESFSVCGEEALTAVVGWDDTDTTLYPELTSPGGAKINAGSPGIVSSTGRTWSFIRVPLPQSGERDGTWAVTVRRPGGGGEFPPPAPAVRYFANVIPSGGATLAKVRDLRRYYTGDAINPLVALRYPNGNWPTGAAGRVTVTRPSVGAGDLLTRAKLGAPRAVDGDTIPARQATLGSLGETVDYTQESFDLSADPASLGGAFRPAGRLGRPLPDLLTVEGDYAFHFEATYGHACVATRELTWSVHVDVGIDPGRTTTTTTVTGTRPDGRRTGTVVIVPRDRFGNHLGPGRGDDLTVGGGPTTTVTGPVQDNGDGSYTVPVAWDPASGGPSVVVTQPDRPAVVVSPPGGAAPRCRFWRLLCLLLGILVVILVLVLLLT